MFEGRYYNGRDARAQRVECVGADAVLSIRGVDFAVQFACDAIRVTPRLARTFRTLFLPDGAQVQTDDNDAVDALFPRRNRLETLVEHLERHATAVAASIVISIAALVFAFAWGVPWFAERIAQRIPSEVERKIGDQTLATLRRTVLKPSKLPQDRRDALRARFAAFTRDIPGAGDYRLDFHAASRIGPNAFALPGGTIVFTDEMVQLLDNDDEFLAIAAHEIGHEQHRHLMRNVLQDSAVILIATLISGDVSSASAVVVSLPTFLLQSHYSRAFESDADEYAFAALKAHDISPQAFAEVMQKFIRKYPGLQSRSFAYFSSHPPTAERIWRATEAANSP
ncbi:MAG: M48 family metallopeptidase [Gammaproteobacteria bacterium]|nr:MAG: M48 family metallopeptidase [Gammaproteobacteria bacterium]